MIFDNAVEKNPEDIHGNTPFSRANIRRYPTSPNHTKICEFITSYFNEEEEIKSPKPKQRRKDAQ